MICFDPGGAAVGTIGSDDGRSYCDNGLQQRSSVSHQRSSEFDIQ